MLMGLAQTLIFIYDLLSHKVPSENNKEHNWDAPWLGGGSS